MSRYITRQSTSQRNDAHRALESTLRGVSFPDQNYVCRAYEGRRETASRRRRKETVDVAQSSRGDEYDGESWVHVGRHFISNDTPPIK